MEMEDEFGPLLTSHQLYWVDLHLRLPRNGVKNQQELQELTDAARRGDNQAKEQFIHSLLPCIYRYAERYCVTKESWRIEIEDLVCVGNLALVEYVDRSLQLPHTRPYLLKVAYDRINRYGRKFLSIITQPENVAMAPPEDIPVEYIYHLAKTDFTDVPAQWNTLHEAIAVLNERQQTVVDQLYGFKGKPVLTLTDIAGKWDTKEYKYVQNQYMLALKRLKRALKDTYPLRDRSVEIIATDRVRFSQQQLKKLRDAYQRLRSQGTKITVDALCQESGVSEKYTGGFLRQHLYLREDTLK